MLYYNKSIEKCYREVESDQYGLSSIVANERLSFYGKNQLSIESESLIKKIIEPFKSIFILILFVAGIISFLKNDILEGVIVLTIIVVNTVIYYVQKFSTDRILRALQKNNVEYVDCFRDGTLKKLDSSFLVPGDVISLSEGDKVPADARVIFVENASIDESILTGESLPVSKTTDTLYGEKAIYEQSNIIFKGTSIVSGQLKALVFATANQTEYGKLASLTVKTIDNKSPIQIKIDKFISKTIIVILAISITALAISIIRSMELLLAIQFVLALTVAAVPEGLPIALSVILVLGMRRMAVKKALVRNMRAIESIGALNVIATDKTGTLTLNKLTIQETWQPEFSSIPLGHIVRHSVLENLSSHKDPLDVAMAEYSDAENIIKIQGNPVINLPFDQQFAMSGTIWHHKNKYHLNIKGAPEHVLERSTMTEYERELAHQQIAVMASKGYRVIAIATRTLKKTISNFVELEAKDKFNFVGFIGVADTIRPEAKSSIQSAISAGITVKMITGDHFETAYQIGKQLGLVKSRLEVFDSRKMHHLNDEELAKIIDKSVIFSRVIPENKFRILTILKKKYITAMTGDGVNDVPALKNSHVGIAMGSGSQMAKDACDILLLDDNFKSIVDAVNEGRKILSNIRRMIAYLITTTSGEILTVLGALIVGLPSPLLAVQILWINLVTDTALVIPLGLEPGDKNIMNRPPEKYNAPLIHKDMILRIIITALTMALISLIIYVFFLNYFNESYAQTITFCSLVVMQWANAINMRSTYGSILTIIKTLNKPFIVGLFIAISLQVLAIFGPLQSLLKIEKVNILDLLVTSLVSFISIIIVAEILKLISRRTLSYSIR